MVHSDVKCSVVSQSQVRCRAYVRCWCATSRQGFSEDAPQEQPATLQLVVVAVVRVVDGYGSIWRRRAGSRLRVSHRSYRQPNVFPECVLLQDTDEIFCKLTLFCRGAFYAIRVRSGKPGVMVWRSSVRLSVCPVGILNVTH